MTSVVDRRYAMVTPCPNCPFRLDVEPYLRPERAQEIADGIATGGEFACHKTTVSIEDGEGNETLVDSSKSLFCAGAMATMVKSGFLNQMLRIAERQGWFDPEKLRKVRHLVSSSLGAWVQRFRDDIEYWVDEQGARHPLEHCHASDDDCEDPAGYAGMGANPEPGTLDPTDPTVCCEGCGEAVCPSCRSACWDPDEGQFCTICHNPEFCETCPKEGS